MPVTSYIFQVTSCNFQVTSCNYQVTRCNYHVISCNIHFSCNLYVKTLIVGKAAGSKEYYS
jgi:hypothetical protein